MRLSESTFRVVNPTNRHRSPADSEWLRPPEEQQGLTRYVETLRERIWVVVVVVAITTAVAIAYLVTATKQYESEADMFINPISCTDPVCEGLPVIHASTDPTRDVETAARLIASLNVAARVQDKLDSSESPQALLDMVTAEPVAQSNIVAVTAQAPSPEQSQELANAFAEEAVAERTQKLHQYIDTVASSSGGNPAASSVDLDALRDAPDPSVSVETPAQPGTQVSPRPLLTMVAGVFGGLVLGVTAAFAFQVLDPRLRREEQLRRLYRVPILARIPRESASQATPLNPTQLSPATAEAYRTLRGTLAAARRRRSIEAGAVLITGSSASEGKTTTGISLAASLAAGGTSVILIEADLRRPAIAQALDLTPTKGIVSVLIDSVELKDALVTSPAFGPNLGFLLADSEGGFNTELFALPAARELIESAKEIADYVVIDSPPLVDVIDTLPLASYVDDILVVVRLGRTRLSKLTQLGELLAENGLRPSGFAVVGTPRPSRSDYHYYADRGSRLTRGQSQVPASPASRDS